MKLLSVTETAARLGISPRRVRVLIAEGRLPASRVGAQWAISEKDLTAYTPQPVGWQKGKARK